MGAFSVAVEIGNPEGTRYESVAALVDTGASYTSVPDTLLRRLGVPVRDQVKFILSDGNRILRNVGLTWTRIDGKSEITLVVFGDKDAAPLLGAYTVITDRCGP